MHRSLCILFGVCFVCSNGQCQVLARRPAENHLKQAIPAPQPEAFVPLAVPAGTPVKVVLNQEVRLSKAGQPIRARTAEPLYAFDKLVVPAGAQVLGKISAIDPVGKKRRILAAMNANFTPPHKIHVAFDELVLSDGRHIPINTQVSPASRGVLQFVPANQKNATPAGSRPRNYVSQKIHQAKDQIRQELKSAKDLLHHPGKTHQLKRYAIARLPVHPQYLDAGTAFNADLLEPLEFGRESLKPDAMAAIGTQPPNGSVVHALLVTPLSSASNRKDDPVEAVINQPLVISNRLFLPQGSLLRGSVLQSKPARRLGRNGHLRIVFHQVVPPAGTEQRVEASLEGVEAAKGEHLTLDSEGGAQVTSPRSRYFTTAVSVLLATSAVSPDHDRDAQAGSDGGNMGGGAANGASGFGLVGTVVGAFARSRVVSSGFGVYGASMSVYSHFLARGHDVIYPKDMSMLIGLSAPDSNQPLPTPAAPKSR